VGIDIRAAYIPRILNSQLHKSAAPRKLKSNRVTYEAIQLQEKQMRTLYKEHRKQRSYLQTIAERMDGNFKKSQIGAHLRKLGLKKQVRVEIGLGDSWVVRR